MALPRRQFLRLATGTTVLPIVSHLAWAQAWPTKPIRTIVPFTAGSASDIIARTVFALLSERLVSRLLSKTEQVREAPLALPSWRRLILMDIQFS